MRWQGVGSILAKDAAADDVRKSAAADRVTASMDAAEAYARRVREAAAAVEACKAEVLGKEVSKTYLQYTHTYTYTHSLTLSPPCRMLPT